jgi:hypothetical protein
MVFKEREVRGRKSWRGGERNSMNIPNLPKPGHLINHD